MEKILNTTNRLRVSIDQIVYSPSLGAPSDRPFCFLYFVSLRNCSMQTIFIKGRKWVLTNAKGEKWVTEGQGVVGKQPVLQPGECFRFNSCHYTDGSCEVEGAFFGVDEEGDRVIARVTPFALTVPELRASMFPEKVLC